MTERYGYYQGSNLGPAEMAGAMPEVGAMNNDHGLSAGGQTMSAHQAAESAAVRSHAEYRGMQAGYADSPTDVAELMNGGAAERIAALRELRAVSDRAVGLTARAEYLELLANPFYRKLGEAALRGGINLGAA